MSEILGLISPGPFYALAILACPVGMGAMMWFMMRGGRHGQQMNQSSNPMESSTDRDRETELTHLRAEIDEIRANQVERDNDLSVERK